MGELDKKRNEKISTIALINDKNKKKEAELKNSSQASNKEDISESQDKLDKENVVKKEGLETRVEKDATTDDLFSAHNFDITIDLDVSGNNSAANVNLKPVTSTKQGNVGPKKSLNLADYKKKRGLI